MTDKEKKVFLRQIKKEWEENSLVSHYSFLDKYYEKLQFLYINGYLTKRFYYSKENEGRILSPTLRFPLSKKGAQFISSSLINIFQKNALTLFPIVAITALGILTWIIADKYLRVKPPFSLKPKKHFSSYLELYYFSIH